MSGVILSLGLLPQHAVAAVADEAARGVELHRKGEAVLVFRRPDGQPAAGLPVEVRQTAHAFRFGNVFRPRHYTNDFYRARFKELFNFVSLLEFNWGQYEPEEGRPRLASRLDFINGWCRDNGLDRFYGHMLVWTPQRQDNSGSLLPQWLFSHPPEQRTAQLRRRIEREVRDYRDVDIVWDVVNEAIHCRRWGAWDKPGWVDEPIPEVVPYVGDALAWAHAANPQARLLINDYRVIPRGKYRQRYAELIGRLQQAGAPLHAVGIQAHEPDRGAYWFSPEEIWEACDVFGAQTGLPIYFTEFWYTSDPGRTITGSYRQGQWSPERQAEAIEEFYRIAFGHPAVEAIIYFGLTDADPPGYPNVCLLDEHDQPKPAWHRLRRLLREEWTTRLTATTTAEGEVRFRGFHGAYEVRAQEGPASWEFKLDLQPRGRGRWEFILAPGTSQPGKSK
ncbi:MAG: endo-1,4-beta-xylanase [Verrucomicrobia bacterium]|nr:endo-1,4-beta-xylanase [Verrucomicrobiota bacterium]